MSMTDFVSFQMAQTAMMQQAMLMNAMSNNPSFAENPQLAQTMAMGFGVMNGGPYGPYGMMNAAMNNGQGSGAAPQAYASLDQEPAVKNETTQEKESAEDTKEW